MKRSVFFVTGTNTGVGKTVLTSLLARHLHVRGEKAVPLKPLCSGGREDAQLLRQAAGNILTLDETNPWHFRLPLSPVLAARKERRKLSMGQVVDYINEMRQRFPTLIIEGAGGLLSPLGELFDARDLIHQLQATPIVVGLNQLGAINQIRLVMDSFTEQDSDRARIVLMSPRRPDLASKSNLQFLKGWFGRHRVHGVPWLRHPDQPERSLADERIRRTIHSLVR